MMRAISQLVICLCIAVCLVAIGLWADGRFSATNSRVDALDSQEIAAVRCLEHERFCIETEVVGDELGNTIEVIYRIRCCVP